ncbi:adipose-secreted signaling protein-like isoform X2 [Oculina patagonica]
MADVNHHAVLHEEDDNEDGHHHVHFPDDVGANTEIQLRMKGHSIVNVHLGFLQHKHKYEVQFTVPISPGSTSLTPVINTPFIAVGNVNSLDGKGHEITLELDAHKEGLLRDKFVLKNEADQEFVIVLHARVLGARKGTPMLKEGIRCIHHEKDDEEDHSDWQGFE